MTKRHLLVITPLCPYRISFFRSWVGIPWWAILAECIWFFGRPFYQVSVIHSFFAHGISPMSTFYKPEFDVKSPCSAMVKAVGLTSLLVGLFVGPDDGAKAGEHQGAQPAGILLLTGIVVQRVLGQNKPVPSLSDPAPSHLPVQPTYKHRNTDAHFTAFVVENIQFKHSHSIPHNDKAKTGF